MRRAVAVLPAGTWAAEAAVGRVVLTWADRHRRRIRLVDEGGTPFLLNLERAALLADGDGLALEGGGIICVAAAPEPVLDVGCPTPATAARIAWHIGNRHVPIQVLADGTVRLLDDHVLSHMLRRLGVEPVRRTAPFAPEPGAYAGHAHEP